MQYQKQNKCLTCSYPFNINPLLIMSTQNFKTLSKNSQCDNIKKVNSEGAHDQNLSREF